LEHQRFWIEMDFPAPDHGAVSDRRRPRCCVPPTTRESRLPNPSVLRHRENRLLAALSRDTLALLEPALKEIAAPQGSVLLEPEAPVDRIYFPQSGMISLLIITRDGGMIETSTVGREGAVGLHGGLGERRSFTRASVQIPGRFSTISARVFRDISRGSVTIRDLIAQYTELQWAEAQQIAACNAIHDAASRLSRWLLQSADRVASDELPLTQEFLAHMLGVRRTTVTLLAQVLQKRGLIRYSRGRMTILDRRGLEACTCECYQVMKREKLALRIGVKL
jgi:CRP-like cAMP-binding protein